MTKRLKSYSKYLQRLQASPAPQRLRLLKEKCKEDGFVRCLCDCAKNILKGNVPLTAKEKQKLAKHKRVLRLLVDKRASLKRKKDAVVQKGGFIGALLGPVVSVLGSLLGGLLPGS